MRISDWSSDVCSSDLLEIVVLAVVARQDAEPGAILVIHHVVPAIAPEALVPRAVARLSGRQLEQLGRREALGLHPEILVAVADAALGIEAVAEDRKSTRLNSSH